MKPKSLAQHHNDNHSQDPIHRGFIQNIDDAKNWLDKAKDEFIGSNTARGELNLSLAQAEVRRAWELSREQCVSTLQEQQPAASISRKSSFLLPLAAGLGMLMLIAGSLYWIHLQQHSGMTTQRPQLASRAAAAPKVALKTLKPVPVQTVAPQNSVVATAPVVPIKPSKSLSVATPHIRPGKQLLEVPAQETVIAEPSIIAEKSPETVKKEMPVVKEAPSIPETVVAVAPPAIKETQKDTPSMAATENPRRSVTSSKVEAASTANTGRVQTALQLPEDDLTNIAKRSLKSGR